MQLQRKRLQILPNGEAGGFQSFVGIAAAHRWEQVACKSVQDVEFYDIAARRAKQYIG